MSSDPSPVDTGAFSAQPEAELLQALLDRAEECFYAVDADGRLLLWNQACRTLLGPPPPVLPGGSEGRFHHANGFTPCALDELPENRARRGEAVEGETLVWAGEGRAPVVLEVTAWPSREADGRYGALVRLREVADRPAGGQAVAQDGLARQVLDAMLDCVAILSTVRDEAGRAVDLRYEYVNPAAARHSWRSGYPSLGCCFGERNPDLRDTLLPRYLQVVETGETLVLDRLAYETVVGDAARSGVFDIRVCRLGDGVIITWREVGELERSETRFKAALENLVEGAILYSVVRDEDGRAVDLRYEYLNPACRRSHWVDADHCLGRTFSEVYPTLAAEGILPAYLRVLETGQPLVVDSWHRLVETPEGRYEGYFDIRVVSLGDGLAMFYRDVSDRVMAEQVVRESETRLRTCLDSMLDCFALLRAVRDEQGRIVDFEYEYLNAAACENNGRSLEDTVGHRLLELMPGQRGELFEKYVRVVETGEPWVIYAMPYEDRFVGGRHLRAWFDVRAVKLGDGLSYAWRDVTEQVRVEEALRESEQLFRGGFEQSSLGMALLSPEGQCLRVNPVIVDLLETTEAHLFGRGYETFIHPLERAGWSERTQALAEGGSGEAGDEMRWQTETGRVLWAHVTRTLVRNSAGEPWYVLLQVQDVGPRKLAEQELVRRQTELERSNRELGQFVHIASHDLQEPVRKIQVMASRLTRLEGVLRDPEVADQVARIAGSAERMTELVDGLLRYSRLARSESAWAPVPLGELVAEVISDLELSVQESGARVEAERLPTVEGDAAQLRVMFANLLANAIKFQRPGVPPAVRLRCEQWEGGLEVLVQDNGIGFDPQFAERIFQPFQQLHTRAEYPGAGMGLAIARRMALRHDMEIRAFGQPEVGATFAVRIPWSRVSRER